MALSLFAHPFSSYCQKVLTALYENGTPFTLRLLAPDQRETGAEFARAWPIQRMPLLRDGAASVMESTVIIEYLDVNHPGPVRFIPADASLALQVRFLDRVFDNYVMTPLQQIVFNALRTEESRDPHGVGEARRLLDRSYRWLETHLGGRIWAAGDNFSLADCAAAPSLFYADWAHPIADEFDTLKAYRARLLKRPSFARAVDEARPYRHLFPLGAPDRD
ncbi:glutathione S-transferase family protein [Dongia sp.]|uniref:glutathione S-transferase family protein n=1 Tax=Dongia sp. TaxID=1977262 RepID=UPI0035B4A991